MDFPLHNKFLNSSKKKKNQRQNPRIMNLGVNKKTHNNFLFYFILNKIKNCWDIFKSYKTNNKIYVNTQLQADQSVGVRGRGSPVKPGRLVA
jgi:hypothetical protein